MSGEWGIFLAATRVVPKIAGPIDDLSVLQYLEECDATVVMSDTPPRCLSSTLSFFVCRDMFFCSKSRVL